MHRQSLWTCHRAIRHGTMRGGLLLTMVYLSGCAEPSPDPPTTEEPEVVDVSELDEEGLVALAREIHDRVITVDTHVDIPFEFGTEEADPGVRGSYQNDLPKMQEGGLDAAFFIVYHAQGERTPEGYAAAYSQAMRKFDGIRRMAYELYPDEIELAYTADDVERIHSEGKLVALIGVENLYPIGTDLSILEDWYELGARYASLTHNGHGDFGDSATESPALGDDGPEWGGLSPLGEAAVDELNRLGIMVDVSHAHRETMMQAVSRSRAPVIASHSSVRALRDHVRNLDDDQLRAIRDHGGVAQTTALGAFITDETPVTLQDYIDHVEYAVGLIGVDHVGISSDFDGGGGVVGWNDSSETFNVTLELVRRGYSEEDIRKIWGGNLLRVMRDVEQVAEEIRLGGL